MPLPVRWRYKLDRWRSQIAAAVDGLLAVLDEMDGDPDHEPDDGREQDDADLEDGP